MPVFLQLFKSNAPGCSQNMQMKCKLAEHWAEENGFQVDVVMEIACDAEVRVCVCVFACDWLAIGQRDVKEGWMAGRLDGW